jgi:heptaprenyl diphosphate synthase
LQDLDLKLDGIRELLLTKLSHPYLLKYVEAPVIDDDKLLLLISLLDQNGLEYSQVENYTVTTMLLQIALDTHEHVQNSNLDENDDSLKNRQLTVLAGIYFSGLYYKLLADTDDIQVIKQLAAGVKEVNEHKITVYQKEADAIDKLMESIKLIESTLLGKIADHFHEAEWHEFAANWLFVKRLILEEKKFIQSGRSIVFDVLKKLALPKIDDNSAELSSEQRKYLLSICTRYIEFSMMMIETALKKLPGMSSLLSDRLKLIAGQHQSMSKKFVEEG